MKTYFLNYFCLVDVNMGEHNKTDLYYYSGKLIKKSLKNKPLSELPDSIQYEIFNKLSELNELDFKKLQNGYDRNKYFMICSKNKIEVFEVKLGAFDKFSRTISYLDTYEQVFDWQINELRNTAIFIHQEQYF